MRGIKVIYDNGGESVDRYTVYFSRRVDWGYSREFRLDGAKIYPCVSMSGAPFHPQGFCQHSSGVLGRHNGKKIRFEDLPKDCQEAVKRDLE